MTSQVHTVFFDLGKTIVNGQKWVDGAVSLLEDLKRHGLNIGIISNTGDLSKDQLLSLLPEDLKALLAAFLTAGLIPPLHL